MAKRRLKGLTAEEWNAKYPVGTEVRYWPGRRSSEEQPRVGATRSAAWGVATGGDPIPVVLITGYAGGIALSHVEPIVPTEKIPGGVFLPAPASGPA